MDNFFSSFSLRLLCFDTSEYIQMCRTNLVPSGDGKMRDPGNEVGVGLIWTSNLIHFGIWNEKSLVKSKYRMTPGLK